MQAYGWILLAGPGRDGAAVGEGEDGAAEGVFEGDEPGGGEMVIVFEDGVFLDVGEGYVMTVCWGYGYGHSAADTCNTACFPDWYVSDYRFTFL